MDNAPQIENQYLRRQLQSLLAEARHNEEKMRRFDQLERRLIGTHSLADLLRTLLQDYKYAFDLDAVTLALADPEYETARLLEGENKDGVEMPGLILLDSAATLDALYAGATTPFLGAYDAALHHAMLGQSPCTPASVALLPLMRQGELIGSINLGSCETGRFTGDSGTNFLERLAAIVAICLENALNHERLKLVGLTDPLTGINNRRYFEHRCQEEVAHARRHCLPLACMFLDVDKFKRINDTYGHRAGDEVLKRVAALIKSQMRASDIPARYGGEEFVVLLPKTAVRNACDIAERIRSSIAAQPFQVLPGESVPITISIGVSMLTGATEDKEPAALGERLIAAADGALYRAKENGRNRVVVAD
jgi:two-component system, cell cycle response regulator